MNERFEDNTNNRLLQPSLRACEAISRIARLIYNRGVSLVIIQNESCRLGGEIASSCLLAMTNLLIMLCRSCVVPDLQFRRSGFVRLRRCVVPDLQSGTQ